MADDILKQMDTKHGMLSVALAAIQSNADVLGIEEINTDADHKIWVRTSTGEKLVIRFSREFKL